MDRRDRVVARRPLERVLFDQIGLLVGRAITEVAITDQRHFYNSVSSSSFEPSKTHHVNAKFGA